MAAENLVPADGVGRMADSDGRAAVDIHEDGSRDVDQIDERYGEWIAALEEDVIQGEFGYEPGEFTVYPELWQSLFDEGMTPRQAWQRALDAFAQKRRDDDAERAANWARIVSEDAAAIARHNSFTKG